MERIPTRIKSGKDIEKKSFDELIMRTFVNAFLAVLWRENWITVILYSQHSSLPLDSDVIRKCLQYNVFDPTGFGNIIKPYFKQAALTGKLYPEECIGKPYLERVLDIFQKSYMVEIDNPDNSINFIMEYGKTVFTDDQTLLVKEVLTLEKKFNNREERKQIRKLEKGEKCTCNICSLIDNHHECRPESNKNCEYMYMNIIIEGLLGVLQ